MRIERKKSQEKGLASASPRQIWMMVIAAYAAAVVLPVALDLGLAMGYGAAFLGLFQVPDSAVLRIIAGLVTLAALVIGPAMSFHVLIRGSRLAKISACPPALFFVALFVWSIYHAWEVMR